MDLKDLFKIFFVVSVIFALFKWFEGIPYSSEKNYKKIIITEDPIQTATQDKAFGYKTKKYTYQITPLANYKISGILVAKNNLFDGEDAAIGPVDVGIIWGNIATKDYDKYLDFMSAGRWLRPNLKDRNASYPFVIENIIRHASHTHVIPANKNVLNAVNSLNNKQEVSLEGNLVSVSRTDGWQWASSMSREDWGAHACEVMYVKKVQIGYDVYY